MKIFMYSILCCLVLVSVDLFGVMSLDLKQFDQTTQQEVVRQRILMEQSSCEDFVEQQTIPDVLDAFFQNENWQNQEEFIRSRQSIGFGFKFKDCYGRTLLHRAVLSGNYEAVRIFLDYGIDVNSSDNQGNTPLFLAIYCAYEEATKMFDAIVSACSGDTDSETPLHPVISLNYREIIKILLAKGADKNFQNQSGLTPYLLARMVACELRCYDISDLVA